MSREKAESQRFVFIQTGFRESRVVGGFFSGSFLFASTFSL